MTHKDKVIIRFVVAWLACNLAAYFIFRPLVVLTNLLGMALGIYLIVNLWREK